MCSTSISQPIPHKLTDSLALYAECHQIGMRIVYVLSESQKNILNKPIFPQENYLNDYNFFNLKILSRVSSYYVLLLEKVTDAWLPDCCGGHRLRVPRQLLECVSTNSLYKTADSSLAALSQLLMLLF